MATAQEVALEVVREIGPCSPKDVHEHLQEQETSYTYGHVVEAMQRLWLYGYLDRPRRGYYLIRGSIDIASVVSDLGRQPTSRTPRKRAAKRRRRQTISAENRARGQEVVRLRIEEGLTLEEIAKRYSITRERVRQVFDQFATEADQRRLRGAKLEQRLASERAKADAKRVAEETRTRRRDQWRDSTRRKILQDVRAWNELFDEPPSATDWDLSPSATKRFPWRVERREQTGREWSKTRTVMYLFGSWNSAIEAAGLTPRSRTDPKKHFHYNGRVHAPATHCKYGHPMSGENLYVSPHGKRACKKCVRRNADNYRTRLGRRVGTGVKHKDGPQSKIVAALEAADTPLRTRALFEAAQADGYKTGYESFKSSVKRMKRMGYLSRVQGGYVLVNKPANRSSDD